MVSSINHHSSIMFTDMIGYSRMVSNNQDHALKILDEHNNIILLIIKEYKGRVIKLIGDSVFAHFDTTCNAADCAIKIQQDIRKRNKLTHKKDHFHIRIGLHTGQFVVKDDDLFGNDVNMGSRIEGIAPKDGIAVSELFFRAIENNQNIWFREMGYIKLKNIVTPQNIYKLYLDKEGYQKESASELRKLQEEQGVSFVNIETYEESQIQSLAILYLDNLGKDEDEILCYSISDNMISDFKKISSIRSPSFNTVQKYKNSNLPLSEIARQLNVDHIITGNMLKVGDKLKVTLEMLNTIKGEIVWSETWEGNTKYTGTLNGQIISSILDSLEIEIPEHIKRYFTYEMTENADANELYANGRKSLEFIQSHDKLVEAEGFFKSAIELDNQFIEAHAYLGMVYWWMNQFQKAEEQLELSLDLAKKSFNEPGLATVYNFLGIMYKRWKKYPKAIKYFEKGLELNIQLQDKFSEGKVKQNMGGCFAAMLKPDLAHELLNQSMQIYIDFEEDINIGNALAETGHVYKNNGEYTESLINHLKALGMFRKVSSRFNEYRVLFVIADTYSRLGMFEETKRYLEDIKSFESSFNDYYSLARIFSISSEINIWNGELDTAIEEIDEAIENYEASDHDTHVITMLNILIYLFINKGKIETAKKTLRKSERIAEKNEDSLQMLRIKLLKVLILDDNEINQIKLEELEDALFESYQSTSSDSIIENLWLLSKSYKRLKNDMQATKLVEKAKNIINRHAEKITNINQRKSFINNPILHKEIFSNSH